MPAAVIGGAIAGVGAIGAAAIGSGAQSRASREATQAAQNATTQNNALTREIYNRNSATLSPFVNNGTAAGNAINALLGLTPAPAPAANTNQPAPANTNALLAPQPGPNGSGVRYFSGPGGIPYQQMDQQMDQQGGPAPVEPVPTPAPTPAPTTPGSGAVTTTPQQQAFDNFRNSTGYQFRFNEGNRALNTGWAARGTLQSGAAEKAALQYGQDLASGEFGNYIGYLGNQQGVGLSAANALAGVGTNYANNITSQNNALASVQANAALARGNANAGLWSTAAGALGQLGGSLISSYGRAF